MTKHYEAHSDMMFQVFRKIKMITASYVGPTLFNPLLVFKTYLTAKYEKCCYWLMDWIDDYYISVLVNVMYGLGTQKLGYFYSDDVATVS